MGSSTKKKKQKQKEKDFQKPKLKVGKTKAKAANFTDTSFRARSIVVNQQSLTEEAPDPATQFRHSLSVALTSRSDNQRRDALAYLTSHLSGGLRHQSSGSGSGSGASSSRNPVGTAAVLSRVLPLLADPAAPVRAQLLKLLRVLPPADVRPAAGRVLLYVRAGITHLSSAVRDDALAALEWLLDVAGDELVACPGGWLRTLNGLGAMMGWVAAAPSSSGSSAGAAVLVSASGWTSAPKTSFAGSSTAVMVRGASGGGGGGSGGGSGRTAVAPSSFVRQLAALAKLLEIGLRPEAPAPYNPRAFWDSLYRRGGATAAASAAATATAAAPFGHLNLFGAPRDEDGEAYADREDRQRVFAQRWLPAVARGIADARREGGAVGRAAATLDDVVQAGMAGYSQAVSVF